MFVTTVPQLSEIRLNSAHRELLRIRIYICGIYNFERKTYNLTIVSRRYLIHNKHLPARNLCERNLYCVASLQYLLSTQTQHLYKFVTVYCLHCEEKFENLKFNTNWVHIRKSTLVKCI